MKHYILFVLSACYILSACSSSEYIPHEGDLLFQVSETSPMSEAITESTAQHDSIKYDHVAIFTLHDGMPSVIEASTTHGVRRTSWADFVTSSPLVDGRPGVVVMRVHENPKLIQQAVSRAETHLGEPYDWSYLPDNGKTYCSELIYESYVDAEGKPLFRAKPMNFRNAKGEIPLFWAELFQKLGEPIPEGVLGTNPNEMSKDSILIEAYSYF